MFGHKCLLTVARHRFHEKCKKAEGRVLFSGSKKKNPHQCATPPGSKLEQRLRKRTRLWKDTHPRLRGGVANGKHYGLVMTA